MLSLKRYKILYTLWVLAMIAIFWFKEDGSRHRRNAEITEAEGSTNGQHVHSWAIVVSSAVTIILLVLILVLCVGGNKTAPATSSSSKLVVIISLLL